MNPQHQPSIPPHSPNLNNYKFTKERPSLQTPRPTSSPYQPSSPYSRPRQSTSNPLPLNMIQASTTNNPMSIKPLGQPNFLSKSTENNLAAQGDDTGHPLRDSTNEQPNYSSPKDHKQKKVKSNLSFTEDLHKARSILDFTAKSHQDERGVLTERNMKSPMIQQQNQNDLMSFPGHMGNMGRTLLTPMSDLFDRELHLTTPKDYNTMNNEKLGPAHIEGGGTGFFPFMENAGPRNAGNDDNNGPEDGNIHNYHQSGENVSRTQDLLENFYSSLNQLPSEAQERTQPSRLPEMWNLGHNETLNFFRKLPFTEMVPEEYMNEAHQIQPQELDLPNDIVEEFRRNVQNATLKLQEGLREINELFIFSQKTEKLCGDKENEMIHRNKEISNAFSNLSHYIWDYLQNQFNFSEGVNFSQESSLNFQDVREKITSQKFLSELNDDPALDDLLRYFNRLMEEENDENRDLRRNLKELVAYEVLDQELAKYLFGENFDCEAELEERRLVVEEPNPVEEEFKNQYLTISQDLIQMSDNKMEEEKVSMNSGSKMNSGKTHKFESFTNNNTTTTMNEEVKQDNNNSNTMVTLLQKSGDKGRGQGMSNNMGTTPNPTTQVSVTQPSVGHFSEINTYQQQYIEFEEGFMPVEFEEESNYMTGFPFMGGEEFEMNGFDNENENESK